MHISTSVWRAQYPNAGKNIQHKGVKCIVKMPVVYVDQICLFTPRS